MGGRILALAIAVAGSTPAWASSPPDAPWEALPAEARVRPTNPDDSPHQAVAHLVVDREAVAPGEPFRLGILLQPNEGWHSYWKAPGDIGMPLTIDWRLPDGSVAEAPEFPIPERFDQQGIVSYGYEGPVLIFSEVTLPGAHPTGPLALRAHAEWLVCESVCVPGAVDLSLPVEVVDANAAELGPSAFSPVFDHFEARHPTPLVDVEAFAVEGTLSQSAFRPGDPFEAVFRIVPTGEAPLDLSPEAATWPTFTPIVDSYQVYVYETALEPTPDGGAVAVVRGDALELETLPTDARVGALLQVGVGDEVVRTEYTMEVPWAPAGAEVQATASPLLGATGTAAPAPEAAPAIDPWKLALMLAFAFLGGAILNLMPCVLPVVTLKVFGLVEHAGSGAAARRRSGFAYTAGILISFWALAAAVVLSKATVTGIGWGFQFQSPAYVAVLATVVFAFGLSLFGVFEIPVLGASAVVRATATRQGIGGDVLNGAFATLLATPCSAPFLGTAVGFAFSQPSWVIVLFFTVIGLGLAAPFLVVALVPALARLIPRPGPWMETFKHLMGFTLVATTIWLVTILVDLVGGDGAMGFVAFLGVVALASWVYGRWGGLGQSGARQAGAALVAGALAAFGGWSFLQLEEAQAEQCAQENLLTDLSWEAGIPWQDFSEERLVALGGRPVFVDFTASWCLTCKVNERAVIDTEPVREAMERHGVIPLVADWTRRDAEITARLKRHGRAGVPFYLVIPADRSEPPILLGEVITQSEIIDAVRAAAAGS